MRAVRYAILVLAIALGFEGLILTFAIMTRETTFFVIAVWILIFLVMVSCVFLLRGYQRVVSRLRVANERLAHLQYLQERRYDQLRHRFDELTDSFGTLHKTIQKVQKPSENPLPFPVNPQILEELENLNARLQRAERRILGKFEDELFEMDQREGNMPPSVVDNEQP